MWRSRAGAAALLVLTAGPARGQLCAPPTFDGGSRLFATSGVQVYWLEPLLRQHEVCWRRPARDNEKRVFIFGSSGVFGYPHPSGKSAVGLVNEAFDAAAVPAHLFNLAMPWSYAPKDALIVREAERFRPDVIVYCVTLDDSYHQAPAGFAALDTIFRQNSDAVDRFAGEHPPGIAEPLAMYGKYWKDDRLLAAKWRHFRQLGAYVRAAVEQFGISVRRWWFPDLPYETSEPEKAATDYDCGKIAEKFALFWTSSRDWSLLPYLAQLRRETGVQVLVVNWPVAHDPVGDCYNARYTSRDFEAYNTALRAEASALELGYLDLHDELASTDFLDSIHPTLEGQRLVAARLEPAVLELLRGKTPH
jgi:hypothetical protein